MQYSCNRGQSGPYSYALCGTSRCKHTTSLMVKMALGAWNGLYLHKKTKKTKPKSDKTGTRDGKSVEKTKPNPKSSQYRETSFDKEKKERKKKIKGKESLVGVRGGGLFALGERQMGHRCEGEARGKVSAKGEQVDGSPVSGARVCSQTSLLVGCPQVVDGEVGAKIDRWLYNRYYGRFAPGPTEGYEDAIVVPEIEAANFEIKHGLLTLVQNKQFFGNDKEDPHAHIRYFNKITSTLRYPNVPTTSIKLMLFPFSLEGAARIWLEKEPPRSIQTWDDLVAKFINQFFPPSKTTNLRNEITNFKQRFDESFSEAWDRFKDLLRACPHHGFRELHHTLIHSKVRHSRSKAIIAKVSTSTSTSGVSPDVAELKDMVRALLLDKQISPIPAPAPVKAVEQSCVTCGGAHSYRNCPTTNGNNYRDNIQEYVSQLPQQILNQGNSGYRSATNGKPN
ncbi:reverse transcriptase domain-containing protein [Tanacetum coccineum]